MVGVTVVRLSLTIITVADTKQALSAKELAEIADRLKVRPPLEQIDGRHPHHSNRISKRN